MAKYDKKLGAYICSGCGISDRLDVSQLETTAKRDGKAANCKTHEFLCSKAGVEMIQKDIDDGEVNHVIIGGCSRRSKIEAFRFPEAAVTRANLREGCIWIRPDNDEAQETTQEMADDLIRMACAESKYMNIPEASGEQELNKTLMVVGGGITGMTTAIESAKAGYSVVLVEKAGELGGWMAKLHKRTPNKMPYAAPADTNIDATIAAVNDHANITVHLNTTVAKTEGAPGRFKVELAVESGSSSNVEVGAIVQASGFNMYDPANVPAMNYEKSADIVTNMELEALANAAGDGPIKRPSDGKEVTSVIFVQNVGQNSEEEGHLPYHSGLGDMVAIKQAMYFKHHNGDCDTTILFDNLRTPGAAGEDFYRAGQDQLVTFRKGIASEVVAGGELGVKFKDMILDEEFTESADLVVLDVGMVPNSGPDPYAADNLPKDEDGNPIEVEEENAVTVESILNLDYRQGTDLPHLKHGFTDSHFICFPYETRRTGIYSAGPVRRPMDIHQTMEDATGAAMKAIQALENAGKGRAAHPRSGDLSYPLFRKEGCTQCKRCTVECPFGAINEDERGFPEFNESRCRRCGTCMGACPVRVISFDNYSVDTVGQQIKNVDIPEEFDEKPRILVLACENDAYPALDMAGQNGIEYSSFARIIPVRCLGSVNTIWLTDALNSGYDGIVLMGCSKGDEYQCHFVKGSEMAHYRMGKIADTLQTLSLEEERVATYEVAITDIHRAPKLINDMAETIEQIGMSPFKF
ncbi:MAG: hydrogenase iron-sulfur subunit [Gammaproteobacteria bacterium]|mgnify:CR=1 FL=1|jgi:quinone-modifying oxidoreductase subunit QmoB|nr:hydrogenase iron-sulfur subunit [Gammaproteobacteria bacterium]MBT3722463.1 hydrogenase iron-sulfur subunit [Gammaproteobacteria bacterium]MBT4196524.1 hydrogenase iron-sulfur subunit [Gammaproteobacteria bacterium]MBT4450210.1 hydrogenase iron-sulfur subunit [Gammaproteobacteria bacterium]MBT4861681.1 hydrogenase iron-sulfur subunit [Gammaproteobacteria bacterium]